LRRTLPCSLLPSRRTNSWPRRDGPWPLHIG
jgi:hypothetical protein